MPWSPGLTPLNVAALDPHMISGAVRALLLDPAVTAFLALLFDAPPRLTASRVSLRQTAFPERDVAFLSHTLPLQCVAVTFDLENPGDQEDAPAGEMLVWPGSHHLPDLIWGHEHVTFSEAAARRHRSRSGDSNREKAVRDLLGAREPRRLETSAGTRMIRHANLVHAVTAPEPPWQRRSLTGWYCPAYVSPCYAETVGPRTHTRDGIVFSSGVYPDLDPLD